MHSMKMSKKSMSRGLLTLSTLTQCRSLELCPDAPLKPAERAQAVFQKFDILHECTRFDAAKLISRRTAQTQAQDEGQPSRGPTQTICQDTRGQEAHPVRASVLSERGRRRRLPGLSPLCIVLSLSDLCELAMASASSLGLDSHHQQVFAPLLYLLCYYFDP
mmetsp:Transcript_58202/g.136959  ORF Transcript_58202/g.136959 Transcript_58202/m.136959 type:complete len:162 (+) Transcript_58202:266-751(+)